PMVAPSFPRKRQVHEPAAAFLVRHDVLALEAVLPLAQPSGCVDLAFYRLYCRIIGPGADMLREDSKPHHGSIPTLTRRYAQPLRNAEGIISVAKHVQPLRPLAWG